jgi:hypothetical protein
MENPMGEAREDALRLNFDRRLKLTFLGSKVTTNAGLLAYRELDEVFALTVFERNTPFGDEETGVEVFQKSRQMLYFFADSPIPATSMAKLTPRTIETQWGTVVS